MAVDKLVDSAQLDADLTSVANAIRTKGGTSAPLAFPAGFVSAIGDISTGGGNPTAPENDVILIDYDGTIRYSYTAAEFAQLTEYPANPTHAGLTAQGWNLTLSDAKDLVAAAGYAIIGQLYVTESGATEIDLRLPPLQLTGSLGFCINGSVTVDWGDGSAVETVTGSSDSTLQAVPHTWPAEGNYTVKIKIVSGTLGLLGGGTAYSNLFHSGTTGAGANNVWRNCILAIRFGSGTIKINNGGLAQLRSMAYMTVSTGVRPHVTYNDDYYAISECTSLRALILPSTWTNFSNYQLRYNYGLRYASINNKSGSPGYLFENNTALRMVNAQRGGATIGGTSMKNCYSLTRYAFLSTITKIDASAFENCIGLKEITIPANVTTIAAKAFYNCYGLIEIHLKASAPPTLSNSNAFSGILAGCVFYVPRSENQTVLNSYQTASNWSTYASQMQEEPA